MVSTSIHRYPPRAILPAPRRTNYLPSRRVPPGDSQRDAAPGQQIQKIVRTLCIRSRSGGRGRRSDPDDVVAVGQIVDGQLDLGPAEPRRVLDGVVYKHVGKVEGTD